MRISDWSSDVVLFRSIIAPPAAIGGHVTHHAAGCAGLYGLTTHPAPVDADGYTVDLAALRKLAKEVRPKLITTGGSLNLFPQDRKSTRLNSSHYCASRMTFSA